MCREDKTVIRGRLRGRLAALAVVLVAAPGIFACGEDEPAPAPAETGADESGTTTTEAESTSEETAATGGGDPSAEGPDDQALITETLEGFLAGSDPAKACRELVTERFLRRAYGNTAGCEAAQKAAKPADDAGVEDIMVHPDSVAQALARPRGGIYDGQKLRAELVLDDETWRLDSLRSNVPVGP